MRAKIEIHIFFKAILLAVVFEKDWHHEMIIPHRDKAFLPAIDRFYGLWILFAIHEAGNEACAETVVNVNHRDVGSAGVEHP